MDKPPLEAEIDLIQTQINLLQKQNDELKANKQKISTRLKNDVKKEDWADHPYLKQMATYTKQIKANEARIRNLEARLRKISMPTESIRPEKKLEKGLAKLEPTIDVPPEELEELMTSAVPPSPRPAPSIREAEGELGGPETILERRPLTEYGYGSSDEDEVAGPEAARIAREEAEAAEAARIATEEAEAAEEARIATEEAEAARIAAEEADAERIAEDEENAAILAEEQKMRRAAVRRMVEEENKAKKKKKKSVKKKLAKLSKIKVSEEYTRKREKERTEKIINEKRFRTTLTKTKKIVAPVYADPNIICKAILKSGKNLTKKKYYLPSQFPNLTKLKPMSNPKEEKPKEEKPKEEKPKEEKPKEEKPK